MIKKYFVISLIYFLSHISYGQNPPPPPPPPPKKFTSKDKISGDYSQNNTKQKEKPVKIVEAKKNAEPSENKETFVPIFKIPVEESSNANSIYYYKKVEDLLTKLDTAMISAEQIISLTKYKIHSNAINAGYLDSLATKAYKLNEEKNYQEAINAAKQILDQSPNNITAYKESAYAYKRLGNNELEKAYFAMMVKIITSVFKYGDGSRSRPYILNNFFEGLSIYEAKFQCLPKKTRLILTTEKKLIAGYDCFHIMRFADLNHWLPSLKEGDYKIEE